MSVKRRLHHGRMPVMAGVVVEMLQHRALVLQLLEWAAACTLALTVSLTKQVDVQQIVLDLIGNNGFKPHVQLLFDDAGVVVSSKLPLKHVLIRQFQRNLQSQSQLIYVTLLVSR